MLVLSTPHDEIGYVYHTCNYRKTIERGFFNSLDWFLSNILKYLKAFDFLYYHILFIGVKKLNLLKLRVLNISLVLIAFYSPLNKLL
jgi:hypothetical protein